MDYEQTFYLNNDFRTCLNSLMEHGLVAHPRGTTTRELLNYNVTLRDPRNRVITFPARRVSTKYLLGEFIWYLGGSNDPAGILPYAKFWDGIRNSGSEEGYYTGTINSNYGNRLFGHCDLPAFSAWDHRGNSTGSLSQWNMVASQLVADKDCRQAIMNIHVPSDRHAGNKDVACTLTLQWLIRNDKLHLIVNMRSNDVIFGFTNDVFQFTMLQEAMMLELRQTYPELQLGFYFHNAGSMHIYDRHFEMAQKIIATPQAVDVSMIAMDRFDDAIMTGLIGIEAAWQVAGAPEDFEFDKVGAWNLLSPYWQTLVRAFFNDDEAAIHVLFGQTHAD
jgi:thymidylate synthase